MHVLTYICLRWIQPRVGAFYQTDRERSNAAWEIRAKKRKKMDCQCILKLSL